MKYLNKLVIVALTILIPFFMNIRGVRAEDTSGILKCTYQTTYGNIVIKVGKSSSAISYEKDSTKIDKIKKDAASAADFQDLKNNKWYCPNLRYSTTSSGRKVNITTIGKSDNPNMSLINSSGEGPISANVENADISCEYKDGSKLIINSKSRSVEIVNPDCRKVELGFDYSKYENLSKDKKDSRGCPSDLYNDITRSQDRKTNDRCYFTLTKISGSQKVELGNYEILDEEVFEKTEFTGGCGFIGPNTLEILEWIIKLVRIGAPILVIILGIVDFVSAIFSDEDDALNKAGSRFIKRLMAGVILLFVPYILKILIDLSGIAEDYSIDNMFCIFFN